MWWQVMMRGVWWMKPNCRPDARLAKPKQTYMVAAESSHMCALLYRCIVRRRGPSKYMCIYMLCVCGGWVNGLGDAVCLYVHHEHREFSPRDWPGSLVHITPPPCNIGFRKRQPNNIWSEERKCSGARFRGTFQKQWLDIINSCYGDC